MTELFCFVYYSSNNTGYMKLTVEILALMPLVDGKTSDYSNIPLVLLD